MSERYPVIHVRTEKGHLKVRDGLVICFFVRRNHTRIAQAIWQSLQTYLRAIPPDSLGWYGDAAGDTLPLDADGWMCTQKQMLNRPRNLACTVGLSQFAYEAGGYNFEYTGYRIEPLLSSDERAVCAVCFSLPTNHLLEHGPDAVRALALQLSQDLPFSFGYVSLAFLSSPGGWYPQRRQLLPLIERYWGMDLLHLATTSRCLGTGARGAYWLTFLGQPLMEQLGGLEVLRRELPFPEISFQPLRSKRLLLTLGEWPSAMDTREPLQVPHFRALSRLLEPYFPEERIGLTSLLDDRSMGRWLRRFCLLPSTPPGGQTSR